MSTDAYINPKMLTWGRVQKNLSLSEVASAFSIAPNILFDWEEGVSRPTLDQARDFSAMLGIPFGYLYLSEPPRPEHDLEIRERPNSIETHRNAKAEWSVTSKVYFGNSQEDAEAALEWLADLNLRLMLAYPPVDDVQAEVLTKRLEMSLTAASQRNQDETDVAPTRKRVVIAETLDRRVNERLAAELEKHALEQSEGTRGKP